jgi:hypothetical protein
LSRRATQAGGLDTGFALPESQDGLIWLRKSGQTNITTRSEVNREIRWGLGFAFHFIFVFHLRGIVRTDKFVQLFLKFVQRKLKCPAEGDWEKFLQQVPVEFLTDIVVRLAGPFHGEMPDLGSGKESFIRVSGNHAAIFGRLPGVNFFDRFSEPLEIRQDA